MENKLDKNLSSLKEIKTIEEGKKFESYIQKTEIKNVSVLTRGIIPPNPSELLASEKNKHLVELLSKKYDYIIWDGVPVIWITDSLIMADLVDKIVVVSSYKKTPIELLKSANNSLEKFKGKIAGVVLNNMPFKGNHYYTSYYTKNYIQ